MTYAKRTDGNQKLLVKTLRSVGWRIYVMSGEGRGISDLLGWHPGRRELKLIEIKMVKGSKLTKAQLKRIAESWPLCIVKTVDEALEL